MQSNLLVTKIIVPTQRHDVLHRARLLDFLHEYINRKLILISAAAGYGKTSLLVDFAHDTKLPVCWYSLDESDQDLHVFLEYLVAAMQRLFPQFGGRSLALLREPEQKSLDAYVAALITDIHEQIDSFFVLVLDDYHLVEASETMNRFLDRFLYYLPDNAHLMLSSRTIPTQLTLSRLTAQLEVVGLGTNDLRFTADEIRVLIQKNFGLEITPTIADELATQSEGWITGIVLTTPTLWRGLLHEWIKGFGPGLQLFDYLADEVWSQQSAELQQFLLDSSVLAEINIELCNELLGRSDSEAMLQLAEKRNLFVTRVQDAGFRYHHLFRDFLQARLRQMHASRHAALLEKAARVFERRGKLDQAIEYWLSAKDSANAARLILLIVDEYYERGRANTLSRWLNALGEEVLRDEPLLLLWRAILDSDEGAMENAQRRFDEAIAAFERRGDALNHARALITSARHDAMSARAMERCERALALLPDRESFLHALGYRTMGGLHVRAGQWESAIDYLERASTLAELADQHFLKADAESDLGGVYFQRGGRTVAETHFQKARAYWERIGHSAKLANVLNSLAVTRYHNGELARALELLLEAARHAHQAGYLRVEAYVYATLGDVYRDQGDFDKALEAFSRTLEIAEKIRENSLVTYARVAAAEIWRMNGEMDMAQRLLQAALSTAMLHDSNYEVGQAHLGMGVLAWEQQDDDTGMRHLERAAQLFERADAKRELGRARFWLAASAIRRQEIMTAVRHLRALASLGKELDEDQFLISDAVRAKYVLEFGIQRNAGVAYLRRVLRKLPSAPQEQPRLITLELKFPQLELRAFGELQVQMDGTVIPKHVWQTAKTIELFFFLALNPQAWRKEQIIEHLWAGALRNPANDQFHVSVHRIRRALFKECLVFHDSMYQINPEMVYWLDVQEFDKALIEAEQASDGAQRIQALERAIALYRGDFMYQVDAEWCLLRREQHRTQFLEAMANLGRAWHQEGDTMRALEFYQKVLDRDPLHEATYRDMIQAYMAVGNRTAAMQTFQQCAERLEKEFGVSPMPETLALYRRLVMEG